MFKVGRKNGPKVENVARVCSHNFAFYLSCKKIFPVKLFITSNSYELKQRSAGINVNVDIRFILQVLEILLYKFKE